MYETISTTTLRFQRYFQRSIDQSTRYNGSAISFLDFEPHFHDNMLEEKCDKEKFLEKK